MTLNSYFSEIYCINLDRRPDRYDHAWKQFKKLGIFVKRYPAVDKRMIHHNGKISLGELACAMSHYNILKSCKEKNLKNVLIFEDDVTFRDDFYEIFNRNINKVPKWDMLYLGGNHLGGLDKIDDEIFKLKYSFAMQAYSVSNEIYDIVLEKWKQFEKPCDVSMAELHSQHDCYVIHPKNCALTWQNPNFSDILDCPCNYEFIKTT